MLNLLFISDSPKVQYIKSVLQPVLKVIIDVVPDFDHGLKDVFEKRPSAVCIHEHIAGVTGESVARHIQMLLGTGSPKFILMHEGSSKARSIKGLFEHIVDLNQSDANLSKNFQDTLEALLGDQWIKIYTPPVQAVESLRPFDSVPEHSQMDADKLVEDFLSDLDAGSFSTAASSVESDPFAEELNVSDNSDKIAELLLAQSAQAKNSDVFFDKPLKKSSSDSQMDAVDSRDATVDVSGNSQPDKFRAEAPVAAANAAPSLSSIAADFKIRNKKNQSEELIPEELLVAFEENYRTESAHMKRNVLVLSVLLIATVAGGWYFLKQKPLLPDSMKQRMVPAKTMVANPSPAVSQPQKSKQESQVVNPVVTTSLPKFIPLHGHDKAYSAKNPGWERYVGNNAEFRVFNDGGTIKAVQVISVKGKLLTEPFLKSVLSEFPGSADYKLEPAKIKSGLTELRGIVGQKADIVIYKNNGSIRAFVVSLK